MGVPALGAALLLDIEAIPVHRNVSFVYILDLSLTTRRDDCRNHHLPYVLSCGHGGRKGPKGELTAMEHCKRGRAYRQGTADEREDFAESVELGDIKSGAPPIPMLVSHDSESREYLHRHGNERKFVR